MKPSPAHTDVASSRDPNTIGVMVVDDSAVVRGLVSRWVSEDPELNVVGKFANGKLAVDGVVQCAPDIIVLDIEMPVMDGMTALPQLLQRLPDVKVIMASTLTRRNAEISLEALSLGAVDYIPKPEGNAGVTTSSDFRADLLKKIKAVGGTAAPRRLPRSDDSPASVPAPTVQKDEAAISLRPFSSTRPRVLAIGSSTGGPKALAKVIKDVAAVIDIAPVLITQHMPATFTSILAEHLGRDSQRNSKEAEDGEPLRPGTIYVAPGGKHMALDVNGNEVVLKVYDGPDVNFCKPAVDPLFRSVAKIFGASALAVVLTGMGHDGAGGAVEIANAGGSVIVQDEATSIVWGMPGATAASGACSAVLPLDQIGEKINLLFKGVTV